MATLGTLSSLNKVAQPATEVLKKTISQDIAHILLNRAALSICTGTLNAAGMIFIYIFDLVCFKSNLTFS